jgi:hypothetical protein
MRHQIQHQSPPLPKDASQHNAPLWYRRTQMQPQFSADSPVVSQSPAEPRPAALTQPGAELAQPAKPRRVAEHGAIAAVLGKRRHVRSDARQRRPVSGGTEACQRHRLRVDVLQADACVPTWSATAGEV